MKLQRVRQGTGDLHVADLHTPKLSDTPRAAQNQTLEECGDPQCEDWLLNPECRSPFHHGGKTPSMVDLTRKRLILVPVGLVCSGAPACSSTAPWGQQTAGPGVPSPPPGAHLRGRDHFPPGPSTSTAPGPGPSCSPQACCGRLLRAKLQHKPRTGQRLPTRSSRRRLARENR